MRSILFALALLAVNSNPATAQSPAAPYQRMRTGADSWNARGGFHHSWQGGPGGWGGGFYSPFFFTPPIVAGSWYERPYPYHFDYYRHRWGGGPDGAYGNPAIEMIPAADCPCLGTTPEAATPSAP